jgi:hypothetical protein
MLGLKLEPKIIRFDPWEETVGACFHSFFKLALEVSGDRPCSDSVRVLYLSRGLAIERHPPLAGDIAARSGLIQWGSCSSQRSQRMFPIPTVPAERHDNEPSTTRLLRLPQVLRYFFQ